MGLIISVTSKKLPNIYKNSPKMISLENLKILAPVQKLPKNVGYWGELIVAKGFGKLPKVQWIAQSGHTAHHANDLSLRTLSPGEESSSARAAARSTLCTTVDVASAVIVVNNDFLQCRRIKKNYLNPFHYVKRTINLRGKNHCIANFWGNLIGCSKFSTNQNALKLV